MTNDPVICLLYVTQECILIAKSKTEVFLFSKFSKCYGFVKLGVEFGKQNVRPISLLRRQLSSEERRQRTSGIREAVQ